MPSVAKPVCEELRDILVTRGMAVAGAGRSEARAAAAQYRRDVEQRIVDLLRDRLSRLPIDAQGRVKRTPVATAQRQAKLERDVAKILQDAGTGLYDARAPRLQAFARRSVRWGSRDLLGSTPLKWQPRTPSPAALSGIVEQTPLDGRSLQTWYRDVTSDVARRISAEVARGIANGERPDQILRRVRGTTRKPSGPLIYGRRLVSAIAESGVQHVHVQVLDQIVALNDDVVAGGIWTTMLDGGVCPICIGLAAETMYGPPGFYPAGVGPRPLAHPRCRCFMAVVFLPWSKINRHVRAENRGLDQETIDCLTAQMSSAPTITEWIQSRTQEELAENVGPVRAELLRQGKITAADLIDAQLRVRTLDEL